MNDLFLLQLRISHIEFIVYGWRFQLSMTLITMVGLQSYFLAHGYVKRFAFHVAIDGFIAWLGMVLCYWRLAIYTVTQDIVANDAYSLLNTGLLQNKSNDLPLLTLSLQ